MLYLKLLQTLLIFLLTILIIKRITDANKVKAAIFNAQADALAVLQSNIAILGIGVDEAVERIESREANTNVFYREVSRKLLLTDVSFADIMKECNYTDLSEDENCFLSNRLHSAALIMESRDAINNISSVSVQIEAIRQKEKEIRDENIIKNKLYCKLGLALALLISLLLL